MLSGLRVLDLSDETGHLAGKILGDMGADVLKVEPPGGDPLRHRGPFLGDREDRERSLAWLALNTSKRSIVLDLAGGSGRARLRDLAREADVLLETFAPGTLEGWGLGFASLRADNPGLVYCAITPFGQQGPRAGMRARDLVAVAMGGNAVMTGRPDGPPLRCSLPTAYYHVAPEAALGVAMALWARERSGRGQLVDVSLQETQLGTLITGAGRYAHTGRLERRAGGMLGGTREIWRAKDGWVSFGLRGGAARIPNLIATVAYMDECQMAPDWLRDFDWSCYSHLTASDTDLERLERAFSAFFETRTMRELYEVALERRILLAPCNDAREIVAQPQLRARALFTLRARPELEARIEHPDFFARSTLRPAPIAIRRDAPRLDAHAGEGWAAREERVPVGPARSGEEGDGIFAGLRILELGAGAAGPLATSYFARHGARVVRVESAKRPDFLRTLHVTPQNRDEASILDKAPMFALVNPNKESLRVDLKTEAGRGVVRRLVGWADVVAENFAPGVMERFGLDYPRLRDIDPGIIMVSNCLFGQTGPQRAYPGFGGQGAAICGFNHLTGQPDAEAHGPFATITDSLAPRYVALAIAAALLERRRTGQGQWIDVSQIETGVYSLSEMVVRYSASGEIVTRRGNRSEHAAPHQIYPCRGEDRWIAIAVHDDEDWRRLVDAMGAPAWAAHPRHATAAGRLANEAALDAALASWTRDQEPYALMERLQAAGVEAGVVQDNRDLLDDPQLAARGHFVRRPHAELGELWLEQSGFRLSEAPAQIERPGPMLGEHTEVVLRELLGMAPAEIEALQAAGALD